MIDAAAGTRLHALVYLAVTTGMRQGELLALTSASLHLDDVQPRLYVTVTLTEDEERRPARTDPKTKSSRRRVELDDEAVRLLEEHMKTQRVAGVIAPLVFTTERGQPIRRTNFLKRDWKRLRKKTELPHVSFHSLRHVVNSILIDEGAASLLDLQRRLGHATLRMTRTIRAYDAQRAACHHRSHGDHVQAP